MAPRRRGSGRVPDRDARQDGAGKSRTEGIRAFFAIELDGAARREAARIAGALRAGPGGDAVRWVRPENLHVTLRFLGDVEPGAIPALSARVREALGGLAPFPLRLGRAHPFPSARRPRVMALDLEPAEPLARLAEAVERGVARAGFEPEARRFRPHLTLGRVRAGGAAPDPPTADPAGPTTAMAPTAWPVEEVVLFRSRLHPAGAKYTPLERLSLGGGSHP